MTRDELNRRNGFTDGNAVFRSYPWHTVTGADFGRSIKWARKQINPITELLKKKAKQ